jgi:hypothetical protein
LRELWALKNSNDRHGSPVFTSLTLRSNRNSIPLCLRDEEGRPLRVSGREPRTR